MSLAPRGYRIRDLPFGQQSADQLPWFHIVTLLTKVSDPAARQWYAREIIQQAWSRDILTVQIKNQLHLSQGAAITNFDKRLAPAQAGLAEAILKDPYHFDFLGLGDTNSSAPCPPDGQRESPFKWFAEGLNHSQLMC